MDQKVSGRIFKKNLVPRVLGSLTGLSQSTGAAHKTTLAYQHRNESSTFLPLHREPSQEPARQQPGWQSFNNLRSPPKGDPEPDTDDLELIAEIKLSLALHDRLSKQEKEEPINQLKNATSKTCYCLVCYGFKPISEFPALKNCKHEPRVCAECYNQSIASQLDIKSWKEIKCPELGCKEQLKHADVQQYAAPEVYARYAPPGKVIL
jgi:hypothetical protein